MWFPRILCWAHCYFVKRDPSEDRLAQRKKRVAAAVELGLPIWTGNIWNIFSLSRTILREMGKMFLLAINWETGVCNFTARTYLLSWKEGEKQGEGRWNMCKEEKEREEILFFFPQHVRHAMFYRFVLHCCHQEIYILKEEKTASVK